MENRNASISNIIFNGSQNSVTCTQKNYNLNKIDNGSHNSLSLNNNNNGGHTTNNNSSNNTRQQTNNNNNGQNTFNFQNFTSTSSSNYSVRTNNSSAGNLIPNIDF